MYYFTFRSVTQAQRAYKLLNRAGIRGGLLRTPKALAMNGCGYSVRVRPENGARAAQAMQAGGADWSRCWRYQPPEPPREVVL